MKRKIYYTARKYLNRELVRVVLIIAIILIIVLHNGKADFSVSEVFDIKIVVSVAIILICDILSKFLNSFIERKCEDEAKLSSNYDELTKKYSKSNLYKCNENTIPIVLLATRTNNENIVIIDNKDKYYELPEQIKCNSGDIMKLHDQSVVYNNINIRLDDLENTNESIFLYSSRTFYYDSLVTNRACDYLLNGKTIREIYEPGKYIRELKNSKFSNHLGFNGFVMTTDGKIPFVFRNQNVSIGKNTWGISIGASLKTEYAVENSTYSFTNDGIGRAILMEIKDELKIKEFDNDDSTDYDFDTQIVRNAEKSIFAFYRDLVEGGKPQFVFFYKLLKTDENMLSNGFYNRDSSNNKSKTDSEYKMKKDGKKICFFTIDELKSATIESGYITIGQRRLKVMPSVAACVAMLVDNYDTIKC